MKKEDKYTMQLGTINKAHKAFDASLKVFKFVWRHALTLSAVGMIVYGVYHGKTPVISGTFFIFGIATFLDWFKMKIKPSGKANNNSRKQMFQYAQEELDSSRFGSSAWAMNPMQPGSPANNLYNLGYMTTKYD